MSDEEAPGRPALSISAAAKASGRDRRTIRRYLDQGRFAGAFRDDEDGYWRVPVDDLLGAGLRLNAPGVPGGALGQATGQARGLNTPGATPGAYLPATPGDVEDWRARALVAEERAEGWERMAVERERTIETLSSALRALQAGPQGDGSGAAQEQNPAPMAAPKAPRPVPTGSGANAGGVTPRRRGRWWQRGG